jgi:acyl-CoA synthetase (AMP-forming)/AMP-acid ligase II
MISPFITDWLRAHAEQRPDAPALAAASGRLSYGDLAARVAQLAGHLAASGVGRDVRVLIALPNVPAAVVASLAVQSLGAIAVEVNREWRVELMADVVARTGVRHGLIWGGDLVQWQAAWAGRPLERLWLVDSEPIPDRALLEDGRCDAALGTALAPKTARLQPDGPALILFTSGSTGRPRGVIQTHRNIDANTRSIVRYLELAAADRALLVLPLHYCYGRSVLQTHLFAGGSIFLASPRLFAREMLDTLAAERCTGLAGVPLTFELMRRQVDFSALTFPSLRYVTQAGGAMSLETTAWARKAFSPAKLYVMYGQTEATARLAYLPPERAADKPGAIGIPIPGVELAVVDETGGPLAEGETGQLVARGDNVTPGYFDEPEETSAILRHGWLWTGDLASRDAEGFFFHRGRAKEILKIGGHRVSPREIEEVLSAHPDVAEAAVVGAPDPLRGEVAVAYVVLRRGCAASASDMQKYCRARMPLYRVPASIRFLDALPRNAAGKVLRAELANAGAHV